MHLQCIEEFFCKNSCATCRIIKKLAAHATDLVVSPYGNYAIQAALEVFGLAHEIQKAAASKIVEGQHVGSFFDVLVCCAVFHLVIHYVAASFSVRCAETASAKDVCLSA